MTAKAQAISSEIILQAVHDIRSPLGALKVLMSRIEGEQQGQQKELIRATIQRIEQISNDLLSRCRENASNVTQTLGSALTSLVLEKRTQYETMVDIECMIDPRLNEIEVEAAEPIRVVSNLINNAIEAGGSRVKVHARHEGRSISITVTDDGDGVPENVLARLKSGAATTHGKSGHGLGLSHAWRFVHNVQGSLRFDSRPGRGTCITLEFPLQY